MKKKNLKNLSLKKLIISDLSYNLKGGAKPTEVSSCCTAEHSVCLTYCNEPICNTQ